MKEHFLEEVAFAVDLGGSAGFFQAGNQGGYKTDNPPCMQIFGPPIASSFTRRVSASKRPWKVTVHQDHVPGEQIQEAWQLTRGWGVVVCKPGITGV